MKHADMKKRVDLPEATFEGYIFDLDGTLVDSMPVHYHAWREALKRAGAPYEAFLEDEFYSCGGKSAQDVVLFLNEKYGCSMEPTQVAHEKRAIYLDMLADQGAAPIQEVIDFISSLGAKPPIAIATGSALPGALQTLEVAGLTGLFDIIITPDDVENGKPAPDMFLLAAEKIGADPNRCIVFEDAIPGIQAAERAGMQCAIVRRP